MRYTRLGVTAIVVGGNPNRVWSLPQPVPRRDSGLYRGHFEALSSRLVEVLPRRLKHRPIPVVQRVTAGDRQETSPNRIETYECASREASAEVELSWRPLSGPWYRALFGTPVQDEENNKYEVQCRCSREISWPPTRLDN